MTKLQINRFTPSQIKPNRMMCFIGKKGSGKSTLIKDIFFHLRDRFDIVVGIAGTSMSVDMFKEFIPDCFIFETVDPRTIQKIVNFAQILSRQNKQRRLLIIMDDVLGSPSGDCKKIFNHNVFRDIAFNQRHMNLTLALSLQYCMELPPAIRSQIDYCFTFQETIHSNKKRLKEYFFGMFDSMDAFSQTLYKCTRNFECLVLDNVNNTDNIENNLFFYKASRDIPNYKLGKSCFWWLSDYYSNRALSKSNRSLFEELAQNLDYNTQKSTKSSATQQFVVEKIM